MASAGTVTVDFAVEIDKANAGIREIVGQLQGVGKQITALNRVSEKHLSGIEKQFSDLGKRAVQAFSVTAIAAFAKQAFSAADATATAAERAGIAVETFSRLQFAAGQTDVEMSALTTGIQRFQISLSKADDESKQAIATLSRFGLEVEQLSQLSIEDQLAAVAEAFKQISDPADRTRLAVELFGKSAGPQLVPLLSQGKAGIQELTAEADRLGITLTSTTAAGIDQADRAIKKLTATLSAYAAKFAAGLSVAILGPPAEIQKLDKEIEDLRDLRDDLLALASQRFRNEAGRKSALEQAEKANQEMLALLERQRELLNPKPIGPPVEFVKPLPDGIEFDIEIIKALKIEVDDLAAAYTRLDQATRAVQDARSAEALEASTAGVVEAQRLVEEEITRDLQFQLQARSTLESQYRQQRYQEDVAYAVARENLEKSTLNSVLGALRSFSGQSKKIAIALVAANKAVAIAQAIQATSVAVMKALQFYGPTPQGFAAAAAAKALGAVQIAAIVASGIGEIRSIRSAGGAPIGSPVNPINTTTAPVDGQQFGAASQNVVQVVIANNVGFDQRVMDQIIAGIREATDDRDVIIFGPGSRQAQEILGG